MMVVILFNLLPMVFTFQLKLLLCGWCLPHFLSFFCFLLFLFFGFCFHHLVGSLAKSVTKENDCGLHICSFYRMCGMEAKHWVVAAQMWVIVMSHVKRLSLHIRLWGCIAFLTNARPWVIILTMKNIVIFPFLSYALFFLPTVSASCWFK